MDEECATVPIYGGGEATHYTVEVVQALMTHGPNVSRRCFERLVSVSSLQRLGLGIVRLVYHPAYEFWPMVTCEGVSLIEIWWVVMWYDRRRCWACVIQWMSWRLARRLHSSSYSAISVSMNKRWTSPVNCVDSCKLPGILSELMPRGRSSDVFSMLSSSSFLACTSTTKHQSQSGRFWATSIASFRETLLDFRSCRIVFIHVVRGRPGGIL